MESDSFTIFCDSTSALQALNVFNTNNPLALKAQEWLYILGLKGITVKFCWVPAHVNISGNEKADKLAKSAAVELLPRSCPIPSQDFSCGIKTGIRKLWQEIWESVAPNKMREITSKTLPWKYDDMPRKWERVLCRLRVGHTHLTHGFLMSGEIQPVCEDCLVPLTVRHLLVECPSLGNFRRRYLSEALGEDGRYSLAKILGEDVIYDDSGIFNFIKEAGLLRKI